MQMHNTSRPSSLLAKSTGEYIKIYIPDILYNQYLLRVSPEGLPEAIGVWVLCMTHCQVSGQIPKNLTHLARLLRVSEKPIHRSWPYVCFDFEELDADHYRHPRIESERQEAIAISEKRRQSALYMWRDNGRGAVEDDSVISSRQVSKKRKSMGRSIDYSRNPVAMRLLDAWNHMADSTGGQIARAGTLDLPVDFEGVLVELGGEERLLQAIQRIPQIPFYCGGGPQGWKASFPWIFQRKSLANLLAQTPSNKPTPIVESEEISDADRALLDQLREVASITPEGL